MQQIATAGNTVVPALLALENLGFTVSVERNAGRATFRARRGEESYLADDPVGVLGLVKLVELRTWTWQADDVEIEDTLRRHGIT